MTGADLPAQRRTFDACCCLMERVQSVPQPVIAAVHGMATAGGGVAPPTTGDTYTVDDVVEECLATLAIPVVSCFPVSHGKPNYTVPLGVEVELDADARTLTFLESGVVESAEVTQKL